MHFSSPITTRQSLLAVFLLVCSAGPAWSHAIDVQCTYRRGKIEVQAFYDDNTGAAGARVRVLDEQGNGVAEGRTDQQGHWLFDAPKAGRYQVVAEAGPEHRAEKWLTIPESPAANERVSEGLSREEFTRFPWLKVAIGLGAIGAFCLAAWFRIKYLRKRPN